MNGPDALQAAWAELAGTPDTSIAGLVHQLGGTRSAANILDVAQRTVERYINRETFGKSASNRQISSTQRTLLEDAVTHKQTRDAMEQIAKRGLHAEAPGYFDIAEKYRVYRTVWTHGGDLDASELEEMANAIDDGDWDAAFEAFEAALFDSYGVGEHFEDGEVDDLEIGYGTS